MLYYICKISQNSILFKYYDLDRSTTHPMFNPPGIRTHELKIMNNTFHIPEMLALTTEPSETCVAYKLTFANAIISLVVSVIALCTRLSICTLCAVIRAVSTFVVTDEVSRVTLATGFGSRAFGAVAHASYKTHPQGLHTNQILLTLKVLVATIDAQWEGMGDVGSAGYEPALLPPCPTIMVLSYSNL